MNIELSVLPPASLKKVPARFLPGVRPCINFLKHAFKWGGLVVLGFASYLFISNYVLQSVQVVGASMFPTLRDTDHYFLNRMVYHLHPPKRNDIVVIKDPTDGVFVVKRIIAMPGESILFKNGHVYVNGEKLAEPYVEQGKATFTCTNVNEELILCGKDQYFVLGDNRDNSFDSRMYGPVRRQNILGSVIR
jgi:signal peptidase I